MFPEPIILFLVCGVVYEKDRRRTIVDRYSSYRRNKIVSSVNSRDCHILEYWKVHFFLLYKWQERKRVIILHSTW